MSIMIKSARLIVVVEILLGIVFLFVPIVFLKQHGPCGSSWPNPDDITIYGGTITGKAHDEIISPLYIFQTSTVLLCIALLVLTLIKDLGKIITRLLLLFILLLLLLFPLWIESYVDIVYGNSDGCDLTTHYQWGYYLFYIILSVHFVITFLGFQTFFKSKEG